MTVSRYAAKPWVALLDDVQRAPIDPADSLVEALRRSVAGHLAARGLERGDRVAVLLQNSPAFVLALFGAWKAGAIVVPVNPMYKVGEAVRIVLTACELDFQTRGDARVLTFERLPQAPDADDLTAVARAGHKAPFWRESGAMAGCGRPGRGVAAGPAGGARRRPNHRHGLPAHDVLPLRQVRSHLRCRPAAARGPGRPPSRHGRGCRYARRLLPGQTGGLHVSASGGDPPRPVQDGEWEDSPSGTAFPSARPVEREGRRVAAVPRTTDGSEAPVPQRLLAAATRLFAEQGYDRTSVQEIVEAAGVTKGALYHYFGSKDDLLHEVYARVLRVQQERLDAFADADEPIEKRLRGAAADVVVTTIENLDDAMIFFRSMHHLSPEKNKQVRAERRRYHERFRALVEEGQEAGVFSTATPADLVVDYHFGSVHHLSTWYRPDGPMGAQEVADHLADLLLRALRP